MTGFEDEPTGFSAATPTGAEPGFNFAQALADRFDEPMPTFGAAETPTYETETGADGLTYARKAPETQTTDTTAVRQGGSASEEGETPTETEAEPDERDARIAALEEEVGRYRPYSFLVDTAEQNFGDPDTFKTRLEEQRILTEKNQQKELAGQYTQRAVDYVRDEISRAVPAEKMDDDVIDVITELVGRVYGPIAQRLAEVEPLVSRLEHHDRVTMAGRTVADLMKPKADGGKHGFDLMDEEAVKEAIVEGRDYMAVAKRTHERGLKLAEQVRNSMKATTQREAVAAAVSTPSTAPNIVNVRGQSATPPGATMPKPGTPAFQKYWDAIMGKEE